MDEQALISAMTSKGHTVDTAKAAIAGRGYNDLAKEYLGGSTGVPATGGTGSYDALKSSTPSVLDYTKQAQEPVNQTLSKYLETAQGQEKPLDAYERFTKEAGVPEQQKLAADMRGQIFQLEDTLKSVPKQVKGTSRESLLTEAQRGQLVNKIREPLLERYSELTTNYGRIQEGLANLKADIGNKVQLLMAGNQQELEPLKFALQTYSDTASRLVSAFTADRESNLQIALAKIRRGEELNDIEAQRAYEGLQSENEYLKNLRNSAASAGIQLQGNETADQILQKIGQAAEEEIAYSRRKSGSGVSTNTNQYYDDTSSFDNIAGYGASDISSLWG